MPIYLSKKSEYLSIPRESIIETNEKTAFLNDPDLLFDDLPQPFRLIDKIVNDIVSEAWLEIQQINELRRKRDNEKNVQTTEAVNFQPDGIFVTCLCASESWESCIVAGLKTGLVVIDVDQLNIKDSWYTEDENPVKINSIKFTENIELLLAIDNDGSAKIYTLTYGRLYSIKKFPANNSENGFQITDIQVDRKSNFICLTYHQLKDDSSWFEIHRIPREQWVKEMETMGKAYMEHVASQATTQDTNVTAEPSTETTTILDRYGLKVSATTLTMKAKYPDPLCATACSGLTQLLKQIDFGSTGNVTMGIGMNHCLSPDYLDSQQSQFYEDIQTLYPPEISEKLHQIRQNDPEQNDQSDQSGKCHNLFCYIMGPLCTATTTDSSNAEPVILINWWRHCQHLLFYNLANKSAKGHYRSGGSESWTKFDSSRSFSNGITEMELSHNQCLLAIGLENGQAFLLDIKSGLVQFNEKLSGCSIEMIRFIEKPNGDLLISFMDKEYRLFGIYYHKQLKKFEPRYITSQFSGDCQSLNWINDNSSLILSVDKQDNIFLYNLWNGEKYLNLQPGVNKEINAPWDPTICMSKNGKCFIILGSTFNKSMNEETEEEEEDDDQQGEDIAQTLLLFKLKKDESIVMVNPYEMPDDISPGQQSDLISRYIGQLADNFLQERFASHNERQKQLQNVWDNLENHLIKYSNIVVT